MTSRLRASIRGSSRVANSKSRGRSSRDGTVGAERKPATEISLSYYVPKCDVCKAALKESYLFGGEGEKDKGAQFAGERRRSTGGKREREKKNERKRRKRSRNHGHKSPVADLKETHHNFCAGRDERERGIRNRNDCFPDVLLELNEKLRTRAGFMQVLRASERANERDRCRVNRA